MSPVRSPGRAGRLLSRGRRSLSLRARLLAGLIATTAVFLVVMGVVSTVVLGTLEHRQLNAEIRLASRQSVLEIAAGADGFAAVYLSIDSGATGRLTPASPTASALLGVLRGIAGLPRRQAYARLTATRAVRAAIRRHGRRRVPRCAPPGAR